MRLLWLAWRLQDFSCLTYEQVAPLKRSRRGLRIGYHLSDGLENGLLIDGLTDSLALLSRAGHYSATHLG